MPSPTALLKLAVLKLAVLKVALLEVALLEALLPRHLVVLRRHPVVLHLLLDSALHHVARPTRRGHAGWRAVHRGGPIGIGVGSGMSV